MHLYKATIYSNKHLNHQMIRVMNIDYSERIYCLLL